VTSLEGKNLVHLKSSLVRGMAFGERDKRGTKCPPHQGSLFHCRWSYTCGTKNWKLKKARGGVLYMWD